MKSLILKFKNLDFESQLSILFGLIFLIICHFFIFVNNKAWHIPTDDEIYYTTGKLYIENSSYHKRGERHVSHIELYTDDNKKIYFTCSYTAFTYTQYSGCDWGDTAKEFKDKIHRKYGEIGWYQQKPLLWFKNPYPQLLSLKIKQDDGQWISIRSKEETISKNKGFVWIIFAFSVFTFIGSFSIIKMGYKNHPKPQE